MCCAGLIFFAGGGEGRVVVGGVGLLVDFFYNNPKPQTPSLLKNFQLRPGGRLFWVLMRRDEVELA